MDEQRTGVDDTPLIVNFLRLIRNGRTPPYESEERVSFHFGGLKMLDEGPFTEADALWRTNAAFTGNSNSSSRFSTYPGPLHLAVWLDDIVVEVWTLEDYREHHTEHSVPRNFEQLEELNTFVRILYSYLHVHDIYRVVTQCCGHSASSISDLFSQRHKQKLRLQVFSHSDGVPQMDSLQQGRMWSSSEFIRISVRTNTAWLLDARPSQPITSATAPTPATSNRNTLDDGKSTSQSNPIRVVSPSTTAAPAADAGGDVLLGGSSAKSYSTPYLVPSSLSNKGSPIPTSSARGSMHMGPLPDLMLPPHGGTGGKTLRSPLAGSKYSQNGSGFSPEADDAVEVVEEDYSLFGHPPPHVVRMSHVFEEPAMLSGADECVEAAKSKSLRLGDITDFDLDSYSDDDDYGGVTKSGGAAALSANNKKNSVMELLGLANNVSFLGTV